MKAAFDRSHFDASDAVGVVVFWAVFLVTLQLAFGVFGPNPISDLIEGIVAFLPNIFVAVVILVIASALAKVVTDLLTATLGTVSGGQWIARIAGFAILVIGIFAALNQLQVAPEIVNGLYYAILVIIVGSAVVAIGGGGIQTMRTYWERASTNLEGTAQQIKQNVNEDSVTSETVVMPESSTAEPANIGCQPRPRTSAAAAVGSLRSGPGEPDRPRHDLDTGCHQRGRHHGRHVGVQVV